MGKMMMIQLSAAGRVRMALKPALRRRLLTVQRMTQIVRMMAEPLTWLHSLSRLISGMPHNNFLGNGPYEQHSQFF